MNNITDYKRLEFELHEHLVVLRDMLMLMSADANYIDKTNQDIELIKTKRFQVAVVGEFKRGKSSLINALLGADILPSDVTPTTATINRITYGNQASAQLIYKDGRKEAIVIDQLCDYVTKLNDQADLTSGTIKEAVITYPVEICRNNIEIIDTPGLNDDERMTEVTLDMLQHIDAAIVTISAVSPVSKTEQNLIAQLIKRDNIETILFVVTYIDQIDEDDRERLLDNIKQRISTDTLKLFDQSSEDIRKKAHRILDDVPLFGISSKQALKAMFMSKLSLLKESGFEDFRSALYQTLISEQGVVAIHKCIHSVYELISHLDQQKEINKIRLQEKLTAADGLLRYLNDYRDTDLQALDQGFVQAEELLILLFDQFHELPSKLLPFFVKSLSSLTSVTNQAILDALSAAVLQSREYASGSELMVVKKDIVSILWASTRFYREKQQFLLQELDQSGLFYRTDNWNLQINGLHPDQLFGFANFPEFSFTLQSIPQNTTLADYNIIQSVKADVINSVTSYIDRWNKFVRQFRLWCFSQAERETNIIYGDIEKLCKEQIAKTQKGFQLNEANYEISQKISKEIGNKIDRIKMEFHL
ncbi:MAG: hypothetical protein K0S47_373 [Herbinix sp.]|jgi:small GTP-binding protein|nr:hypothetical protein [Herbinix sp.]